MLPHLTITYTSKYKCLKKCLYYIVDFILHWLKARRAYVQIYFHHQLGDIRNVWLLSEKSVSKTCG